MIWNILPYLPFGRAQPMKSADDYYIRILNNKIKSVGSLRWTLKKPRRLDFAV
jgi:hypothetical protein